MSVGVGMPVGAGREVAMCLSIMFGLMGVIIGLMFTFMLPTNSPLFDIIFPAFFYGGILLLIAGVALVPGARRKASISRQILEIAAVRKEVTISEISQETGLDRELIRKVLTQSMMSGFLFGYIEGDLFVRDTAGRPRFIPRQRGLFEANE